MPKVIEYVKEHPLTLVLIIGVGILAIILFSSGGASGTVQTIATASGPSDASIAANTAIVGASNQQSFKLAEDTIAANAAAYSTNVNAGVQLAGIGAAKDVQLASILGQVHVADVQNMSTVQIAGIQAGVAHDYIDAQKTVATQSTNVVQSLISNPKAFQMVTQTKDAYLNLPGVQIGRATNYTPPGSSAGTRDNTIANVVGSVSNAVASIFG